jgi:hypothetical protein
VKPAPAIVEPVAIEREPGLVLEVRRVSDPARLRRLVRLLAEVAATEPVANDDESGRG